MSFLRFPWSLFVTFPFLVISAGDHVPYFPPPFLGRNTGRHLRSADNPLGVDKMRNRHTAPAFPYSEIPFLEMGLSDGIK
jgi:hypothetical protein